MPQGKVHTAINITVALAVTLVALAVQQLNKPLIFILIGFIFGTLFINPDLDIAKSNASKRWGVLRFVWYPYQYMFKHRGLSHNIIIGPLSRIIYLIVPFLVFGNRIPLHISYNILALAFGVFVSDTLHILLDKTLKN
jgi:uncharacterized metal-binding protein